MGKKKKGGKKDEGDEEDLDALLSEFKDPNAPPADETPAAGGKKKKGKGKESKDDGEDLDALLNEFKPDSAQAQAAPAPAEAAPTAADKEKVIEAAKPQDEELDAK